MNWWQAIILGLVQGLGEFLPISSSGHLVLLRGLMNISGDYMAFDIMLHVGTLLAIFVVFFKELLALFKPPFKTIGLIILASIPAILVGLFLDDYIEGFFADAKYLGFFFLFTAVMMLATELISKRTKEPKPLGLKTSIAMGLMQGIAVIPGISRSGSTIFGGTLAKGDREQVAKFSFFMSIPIILGSALLSVIDIATGASSGLNVEWYILLIAMAVSFFSGLFAIKLMLRVIKNANFKWFSLYLAAIGIFSIIYFF